MSYYLYHMFKYDFNHLSLKPSLNYTGRVDLRNLGYVQNVVKDQIVAKIIDSDQVDDPRPECMLEEVVFPIGPNTYVNPDYPRYLLASCNGYVFYLDGKITVKQVLNVRGNVDFKTGNIFFVGNLAVHGDVLNGFDVQANDILIKGLIEGANVKAHHNLAVQGGIRGRSDKQYVVSAGNDMRISHAENVTLKANGRLLIERFCLNSHVYVNGSFAVQGRLHGGTCQCLDKAYILERLGNDSEVPTIIQLGYNPFLLLDIEKNETVLNTLNEHIMHYTAVAGHLSPQSNEIAAKLAVARIKHKQLESERKNLFAKLSQYENNVHKCRLAVPGVVFPGTIINIGSASLQVDKKMNGVLFTNKGGSIKVVPFLPEEFHR